MNSGTKLLIVPMVGNGSRLACWPDSIERIMEVKVSEGPHNSARSSTALYFTAENEADELPVYIDLDFDRFLTRWKKSLGAVWPGTTEDEDDAEDCEDVEELATLLEAVDEVTTVTRQYTGNPTKHFGPLVSACLKLATAYEESLAKTDDAQAAQAHAYAAQATKADGYTLGKRMELLGHPEGYDGEET